MKYRFGFFAALVLLLASASCLAADKIVFQLDWLPGGDKAAVYLGVQKGYFADEGIEVTIQPGRGSSDAITKIGTGSADLGTGGISALMMAAAEGGAPVKAVMSIYSKQPDAIFTVKGSGIAVLKDVAGHQIATAPFSSSNTVWPVILTANGLDLTKVQMINADVPALAPMLATGKVDATINWVTVAPAFEAVLKQAGKELVIIPWSDFGLDGYGLCLFASDKMIKERPQVLTRFLRAYVKATQAAVADPAAAAAALKSMVPEADLTAAAAEYKASVPLIKNTISERDGMGAFEPKLLKATWEWVAKAKNYPLAKVDPEKLVDRSFLPKK
jgi:NitT/TauT family transport system substrate-binding protein